MAVFKGDFKLLKLVSITRFNDCIFFQAVVDRILEHWQSSTLYFTRASLEENLPNARNILAGLNNPEYKMYMLFLSYVLDLVTKLNIELQSETSKVPILLERMSTFYKSLLRNFIKAEVTKNTEFDRINVEYPHNFKEIDTVYCGGKSDAFILDSIRKNKTSQTVIGNFKRHVLSFYIELCKQVKNRFNFEDNCLMYASNFSPSKMKLKTVDSVSDFVNLFPQIECDIETVNLEYQSVLDLDLNKFSNSVDDFWKEIFIMKNDLNNPMFPNLSKVVKVVLTLPHSSAAAERGFSQFMLNKTKLRNRLATETCAAILIVKGGLRDDAETWEPPKNLLKYDDKYIETINID